VTHQSHPLIEMADRHLDATFERLDKSMSLFWSAQFEWGRNVMTLASGALVLSISVAQFLIGKSALTHWNWLLPAAWLLLTFALVLAVGHHSWVGAATLWRLHVEKRRGAIRATIAAIDMDAPDISDRFDAIILKAFADAEAEVAVSMRAYSSRAKMMNGSFVIAVALLMAFTIRNLSL
jgi:hypothetical protein